MVDYFCNLLALVVLGQQHPSIHPSIHHPQHPHRWRFSPIFIHPATSYWIQHSTIGTAAIITCILSHLIAKATAINTHECSAYKTQNNQAVTIYTLMGTIVMQQEIPVVSHPLKTMKSSIGLALNFESWQVSVKLLLIDYYPYLL